MYIVSSIGMKANSILLIRKSQKMETLIKIQAYSTILALGIAFGIPSVSNVHFEPTNRTDISVHPKYLHVELYSN